MPTRKISDRERLTIFARTASDDELAEATEILRVEQRARVAAKATTAKTGTKAASKKASKSPDIQADNTPGNGASETGQ